MTDQRESYDYVVVGAGSAGCVLANRLSTDASVLVLEAGEPDDRREVSIPAAFPELFETALDWAYRTEPQPELNDRELYWPRGKTLGGSSSMNAMIYVRGHPADFDGWAAAGNDGWGWDGVEPYFRRQEGYDGTGGAVAGGSVTDGGTAGAAEPDRSSADPDGDPTAHYGTDGPMTVTEPRDPNPVSAALVDAAVAAGHRRVADFNDGEMEGVGFYRLTQERGRRCSAADAYLKPAVDRATLDARTGAHVTRVRFDGTRAVGVTYERDGERVQVDADREVLLCGGAVNSPQLLLLSGVGPADHLAEHGVEVVADSPGVGRNLQDHLLVGAAYECTEPVTLDDADGLLNYLRYRLLRRGPLTSNVAEAGGFVRTDPDLPAPDVQLVFAPAFFMRHGFDNPDGNGFGVGAVLLHPESRGRVRLRSADPLEAPAIDPNYLDADADLETLIEGVRLARAVAEAAPMDEYRGAEVLPGPDATSDGEIAAVVRERTETLYHPVGTCRMGDDERAVVDDRLRVHGVDGLRVVDASVMPSVTGGNTNAPTLMIAEKAAEFVRADAGG